MIQFVSWTHPSKHWSHFADSSPQFTRSLTSPYHRYLANPKTKNTECMSLFAQYCDLYEHVTFFAVSVPWEKPRLWFLVFPPCLWCWAASKQITQSLTVVRPFTKWANHSVGTVSGWSLWAHIHLGGCPKRVSDSVTEMSLFHFYFLLKLAVLLPPSLFTHFHGSSRRTRFNLHPFWQNQTHTLTLSWITRNQHETEFWGCWAKFHISRRGASVSPGCQSKIVATLDQKNISVACFASCMFSWCFGQMFGFINLGWGCIRKKSCLDFNQ